MNDIDIKFISYSGEWPTLCYGLLVLEVNGKQMSFGSDVLIISEKHDTVNYPRFWKSGGGVSFDEDWNDFVWQGEWEWDYTTNEARLPKEIIDNKDAIMRVFNDNVPYGCCGGCV